MEIDAHETQALVSGVLVEKPTVPIEHVGYPDDYELELNIGGQYEQVKGRDRPILVAAGVKNYLIKPCDNAMFLTDISIDWISPESPEDASDDSGVDEDDLEELLEDVSEWREENIDADADAEWQVGDYRQSDQNE
jgi:hypothetical protein